MSRKKILTKELEATGFLVADGLGGFKPVTGSTPITRTVLKSL